MNDLITVAKTMTPDTVDKVRALENAILDRPQASIETSHVFHAGMYVRTIMIPAGVVLTGAMITVPTVLTISGNVAVYGEDGVTHYAGYHILLGQVGRKLAFAALEDTYVTMAYPTTATTVAEAEEEFTSETHLLMSRKE